ncbi:MAG TPA: class I SAM-dependent methyltransferase, partial [Acidimicrobiales bacterium]
MGITENGTGLHGSVPMTGLADRVRTALADADSTASVAATLRARRWNRFVQLFPEIADARIVDLGGTAAYWAAAPVRPAHVVLVNLQEQASHESWITSHVGDVCAPPEAVTRERFDVVYSNSVIEHVGGHANRERMAEMVHGLGERHWVQTPYRYFPVEPHWLFPGFQFLPTTLRARVARSWPLAWSRPPDRRSSVSNALGVELLDRTQLEYYFPTSTLLPERVAGLVKSLIAVR